MSNERISKIIRALLAKTEQNGATESEAMTAAAKARQLMDDHNINVTPEEASKEQAEIVAASLFQSGDLISGLGVAIAEYCDCVAWRHDDGLFFAGSAADTDMACWLFDSLMSARDRALNNWKLSGKFDFELSQSMLPPRDVERSFTSAFVSRVAERLRELKTASAANFEVAVGSDRSRALVLTKKSAIDEVMKSQGLRLRKARGEAVQYSAGAFAAGKDAGEKASLGRPLNASGGPLLLQRGRP